MCEAASCPQARAVSPTHTSRRAQVGARNSFDAAARRSAVQAKVPLNGGFSARPEPPTARATMRPPVVAAARDRPSLLQNA